MPRGRAPLDDPRRCQGHSSRTGKPCTKYAIIGGRTCATHGSSTRQAKAKARERLDALADPAIAALRSVLERGIEDGDLGSAVRAAIAILDRTGFHPKQAMELSGPDGGPVRHEHATLDWSVLRPETRRMLLEDLERAAERRVLD